MDEKVQETTQTQDTPAVATPLASQGLREASKLPNLEELRRKSADYLETVSSGKKLDPEDKNRIITHTLENFDDYFNRGFLHYRKSVAEAEDFAAIEWTGPRFDHRGHHGPQVHRLPRRLRRLQHGHPPPEDHRRGPGATRTHAAFFAGTARPVARFSRRIAGRTRPRRSAGMLLHQQWHRRRRRRAETGAALHQEDRLHLHHRRFPRQIDGVALRDGPRRLSQTVPTVAVRRLFRRLRRHQGPGARTQETDRSWRGHRGDHPGTRAGRSGRGRAARRLSAARPPALR